MGDYSKHNCAKPRPCSRKCCGARIFRIPAAACCTFFSLLPSPWLRPRKPLRRSACFQVASFLLVVFTQVFLRRKITCTADKTCRYTRSAMTDSGDLAVAGKAGATAMEQPGTMPMSTPRGGVVRSQMPRGWSSKCS
ncbi:hypothetical protein Hsc_2885 [Herbaspirillum seropedicae]|nr:hypothetical protein Hsc_2885 [Herbaspirillum seropedicae]